MDVVAYILENLSAPALYGSSSVPFVGSSVFGRRVVRIAEHAVEVAALKGPPYEREAALKGPP